jgi:hypothetical protein
MMTVISACGGATQERDAPVQGSVVMPRSDPDAGVYNYADAKAVGIDVPPIPRSDAMCPAGDVGSTVESEASTGKETGESTKPCVVDPRLALYSVGYSVEAVQGAQSAYEKGQIICSGARSVPAMLDNPRAYLRGIVDGAVGLSASDDMGAVSDGCLSTQWAKAVLASSEP